MHKHKTVKPPLFYYNSMSCTRENHTCTYYFSITLHNHKICVVIEQSEQDGKISKNVPIKPDMVGSTMETNGENRKIKNREIKQVNGNEKDSLYTLEEFNVKKKENHTEPNFILIKGFNNQEQKYPNKEQDELEPWPVNKNDWDRKIRGCVATWKYGNIKQQKNYRKHAHEEYSHKFVRYMKWIHKDRNVKIWMINTLLYEFQMSLFASKDKYSRYFISPNSQVYRYRYFKNISYQYR